ncbi:Peptidyl-prolyl cis-trans isomerase CYP21-4 [Linum perenne]
MARIKPQALLQQSKKKKAPSRISATTIIVCSLIAVLALFFLYSTYKHRSIRSNIQDSNTEDGRKLTEVTNSDIPGYVILTTSKGPVTVELFKDSSPEIVDKFVHLCQKGHFKGMQFHRVIKHYIIQAGNTDNLGDTADWTVKGKHNAQLDARLLFSLTNFFFTLSLYMFHSFDSEPFDELFKVMQSLLLFLFQPET